MYGVKVDNGKSGSWNDWQSIDRIKDNVDLWAHEFGHDTWGPHLAYFRDNRVPSSETSSESANRDQNGFGLMVSTDSRSRRYEAVAPLLSAFEREVINLKFGLQGSSKWIQCQSLTSSGTYSVSDLFTTGGCYRLGLGTLPTSAPRYGNGEQGLYISNVQRTTYFGERHPRSYAGANGCTTTQWGLPVTGLMIERAAYAGSGSGFDNSWSRDMVPSDNDLDEGDHEGDLWRPGVDRQLTPWTVPNVYGYGSLDLVPDEILNLGYFAIDDIRQGTGNGITFDFSTDYTSEPIARVRKDWTITSRTDNLTFNELRVDNGSHLTIRQGVTVTFEGDLFVDSFTTLTVEPGVVLRFGPDSRLIVFGTLDADGATFEAADPAAGWHGVLVASSTSDATISNSSILDVGDASWGVTNPGAAVWIDSGNASVVGTTIRRTAAPGKAIGIKVVGASSESEIRDNDLLDLTFDGIVLDNYAATRLVQNRVLGVARHGLVAGYNTDAWVHPIIGSNRGNEFFDNAGVGVAAVSNAELRFAEYYYPRYGGHHNNGFNSADSNLDGGVFAKTGGSVSAGSVTNENFRRNRFVGNTGFDVRARGSGTSVVAVCDWWGSPTPPFATSELNGGYVDESKWLLEDPYVNPNAACVSQAPSMKSSGAGARASAASPSPLGRAEGAAFEDPASALADIAAAVAAGGREAAPAVTLAASMARRDAPGAREAVEAYARHRADPVRRAAQKALVGLLHRDGDVDGALRLTEDLMGGDLDDRAAALTARVYLLSDLGDERGAQAALETLREHEQGAIEADLAAAYLSSLGVEPSTKGATAEAAAPSALEVQATEASLSPVRPNPTRGGAHVSFVVLDGATAQLGVFDVLGREVGALGSPVRGSGAQTVEIPAGLAPGVYVLRLTVETADGRTETHARRFTVTR
ncbi:hypothetical protein BSZ36_17505 [Rubricoccus marinus]|uniref:Right handed beta helix domain-containing protein n=1 Tax=Rubricoccus marinus TaxID=716817 RepID=A0A259TUQ8_9BACT|nr:hypothetical protein BSZ36_17505 [Rubricoccus marinus]